MLDAARQQAVAADCHRTAELILAASDDVLVPLHLSLNARDGQTALWADLHVVVDRLPHRIDQGAAHAVAVVDENALGQPDLVGSQAHAAGGIHRLQHVADQRA